MWRLFAAPTKLKKNSGLSCNIFVRYFVTELVSVQCKNFTHHVDASCTTAELKTIRSTCVVLIQLFRIDLMFTGQKPAPWSLSGVRKCIEK